MEDDLRESLGKAFDAVEAKESGESVGESVVPTSTSPPTSELTPAPVPQGETNTSLYSDPKKQGTEGNTEVSTEGADDSQTPSNVSPGSKEALIERAPGTWSAEAREGWANLSPSVRAEIWRREKDVTRALSSSTKARKLQEDFEETMRPYLGFIAAENGTPLQAVKLMMNTAAGLRVGTPQQKAQIVFDIIKNYNIDLKMLDDMFPDPYGGSGNNGVNVNHQQSAIQAAVDQRLAPLIQAMHQTRLAEQQNARQVEAEIDGEVEAMANNPKYEFFNDVRSEMADIIELTTRRGQKISLTQAYDRAILLSEPVRRVLESRKGQSEAQRNQQIADKARRTAASVPGSNEAALGITPAASDNLRSTIEAAFAKHAGA